MNLLLKQISVKFRKVDGYFHALGLILISIKKICKVIKNACSCRIIEEFFFVVLKIENTQSHSFSALFTLMLCRRALPNVQDTMANVEVIL